MAGRPVELRGLDLVQLTEASPRLLQQLVGAAGFNEAAPVEHIHDVRVAYGRLAVGPASSFTRVDLPEPFSPTRAVIRPAGSASDTSASAGDVSRPAPG